MKSQFITVEEGGSSQTAPEERPFSCPSQQLWAEWTQQLLDISSQNQILNFPLKTKGIELLSPSLQKLIEKIFIEQEQWLFSQDEKQAHPRFSMEGENNEPVWATRMGEALPTGVMYRSNSGGQSLDELWVRSQTSREENGVGSLYLAIGFLRWTEEDQPSKEYYTPILLLPITLSRQGNGSGFSFRCLEKDLVCNPLLQEMLKQVHGFDLSTLTQQIQNSQGQNIDKFLFDFSQIISSQLDWKVCSKAYLINLSYWHFYLWQDLTTHWEDFKKNKIIHSLLKGKMDFFQEEMLNESTDYNGINHPLLPLLADSSQLAAIAAADSGKSFLLHGPPGTGKSQTITNIIANAIGRGQRVLFVSKKAVALDVVYGRLRKMKLEAFCLNLHDMTKTTSLQSYFTRVLSLMPLSERGNYDEEKRILQMQAMELVAYSKALTQPYSFGFSLYEAIGLYSSCLGDVDRITLSPYSTIALPKEEQGLRDEAVQRYEALLHEIGCPRSHPLAEFFVSEYSPELENQCLVTIKQLIPLAEKFNYSSKTLAETWQIELDFSVTEAFGRLNELAQKLMSKEKIIGALLLSGQAQAIERFQLPLLAGKKAENIRGELEDLFLPALLSLDPHRLIEEWKAICEQKRRQRKKAQKIFLAQFLPLTKSGLELEETAVLPLLNRIGDYQRARDKYLFWNQTLIQTLGDFWQGEDTDWEKTERALEHTREIERIVEGLAVSSNNRQKIKELIVGYYQKEVNQRELLEYQNLQEELWAVKTKLHSLAQINLSFWTNDSQDYWQRVAQAGRRWIMHINTLEKLCHLRAAENRLKQLQLEEVVSSVYYHQRRDGLFLAYKKAFYKGAIQYIFAQEEILKNFSQLDFTNKVEHFQSTLKRLEELAQQKIHTQLTSALGQINSDIQLKKERSFLETYLQETDQSVSSENLFAQIPKLIKYVAPCMLMSPLAVARYCKSLTKPFDLVIFDEASQISVGEALGAIGRGENVVIVGDTNQLLPQALTEPTQTEPLEPGSITSTSILSACLKINFPQAYLRWHYRSCHESLIHFSNDAYYDKQLFTFPSPQITTSRISVIPVQGNYSAKDGGCNIEEAQAVVQEISARLENPLQRKQSLGVVTFSYGQKFLIEELLERAFLDRPELKKLAAQLPELLCIKMAKDIQGDERDVILLSVGYDLKPDSPENSAYGLLGQSQGWRYLNVAITRSRSELLVFTSLHKGVNLLPDYWPEGVRSLIKFLDYALGSPTLSRSQEPTYTMPTKAFSQAVATELKKAGLKVKTGIGSSGNKLDIAIVHPQKADEYVLGIICNQNIDPSGYSDPLWQLPQRKTLLQMGWHLYTLWLPEWWLAPKNEIDKICRKVSALLV